MTVDRWAFRVAGAVCDTDFDRLYHLIALADLKEEAELVRGVDKGQLVARIVTRGLHPESMSPGEVMVIALVCLGQLRSTGMSAAEIMSTMMEVRGKQAAADLLQRVREGAKP
jgi:hypothetical protein